MRRVDGRYECAHCGAALDLGPGEDPSVVIHAAIGKPNMRVISLDVGRFIAARFEFASPTIRSTSRGSRRTARNAHRRTVARSAVMALPADSVTILLGRLESVGEL